MHFEIEISGLGKAICEFDDRNPKVASEVYNTLPIEGRANLWGEEVYFEVPLELKDENPIPTATSGDICYWSPGPAICIFFGKTQPYSSVNHIGRVIEGLDLFKKVKEGDRIILMTG
jgi:hypothetical protein